MPSIELKRRKTNKDFTDSAVRKIKVGEDEYLEHHLWFKRIKTMDESTDLFVECELPEEAKKQINTPEKEY